MRVRRLYLDFGVAICCATEPFDLAGTIGPGVLTMTVGVRWVGVDEPKATVVVFT